MFLPHKLKLPVSSGCYQFFDEKDNLLYIGKAANLKTRVSSYWRKSANHSPAKYSMLKKIARIEIIKTESEIEALLLEANLIKKYHPPYNIIMRDDKRYVYLKISTEEIWPRVYITRAIEKSGHYFGPFASKEAVDITLRAIRKIWPYRSCRALPKRVCLYYNLGQCPGMCEGNITEKDYKKNIKEIISFLEGKKQKIIKAHQKKIQTLEKTGQTDKAKNLLWRLIKIEQILKQASPLGVSEKYASDITELAKTLNLKTEPGRIEGYDIANIFGRETVGSMVVFEDGEVNKNEYRKFKIKQSAGEINDIKALSEVLERRFQNAWKSPDLILLDGGKGQLNAGLKILKKFKLNIPIISISKGEGLRSAHAPDLIFFPGEKTPLKLNLNSPALHILKRVRNEAHRFAITYHKKLRSKRYFKK